MRPISDLAGAVSPQQLFWAGARRLILTSVAFAVAYAPTAGDGFGQNVQRQSYTMSSAMHQELDQRQFDSGRIEQIVVGLNDAFQSGDLGPIIDASSAEVRITDKGLNKVMEKKDIALFKSRILGDPSSASGIVDENRFILRSEAIGINGGEFWVSEECVDAECTKKKTHIITINLP